MNRITILTIACVIAALTFPNKTWAQHDPAHSNYMLSPVQFNPAHAGDYDVLHFGYYLRGDLSMPAFEQYTQSIDMTSKIKTSRLGIGLTFSNDVYGVSKAKSLSIPMSYSIPLKEGLLSSGFSIGFHRYFFDFLHLLLRDSLDPIFTGEQKNTLLDLGLGFNYQMKSWHLGFSVQHLSDRHLFNSTSALPYSHSNTYNAEAGIKLKFSKSLQLIIESRITVSSVFRTRSRLSAFLSIKDIIIVGPQYFSSNKIGGMALFNLTKIFNIENHIVRLGYSIDKSLEEDLFGIFGPSHNLMFTYNFGPRKTENEISPFF